jgi:hypothetical protein
VSLSFLFSTFSSLALTKMMMMMLVVVVFVFDLDDEGICVELKDSTETLEQFLFPIWDSIISSGRVDTTGVDIGPWGVATHATDS